MTRFRDSYATGPLLAGPALKVTSPIAGTTAEASATVAGVTTSTYVWVNAAGQTVRADVSAGVFSIDIPLAFGANGIAVVAVGADGGTTTASRSSARLRFWGWWRGRSGSFVTGGVSFRLGPAVRQPVEAALTRSRPCGAYVWELRLVPSSRYPACTRRRGMARTQATRQTPTKR